jgi:hypothetical protein
MSIMGRAGPADFIAKLAKGFGRRREQRPTSRDRQAESLGDVR